MIVRSAAPPSPTTTTARCRNGSETVARPSTPVVAISVPPTATGTPAAGSPPSVAFTRTGVPAMGSGQTGVTLAFSAGTASRRETLIGSRSTLRVTGPGSLGSRSVARPFSSVRATTRPSSETGASRTGTVSTVAVTVMFAPPRTSPVSDSVASVATGKDSFAAAPTRSASLGPSLIAAVTGTRPDAGASRPGAAPPTGSPPPISETATTVPPVTFTRSWGVYGTVALTVPLWSVSPTGSPLNETLAPTTGKLCWVTVTVTGAPGTAVRLSVTT